MTDLKLAADEVAPMITQIDKRLSNEVEKRAKEFAERADFEHPINRSPKVVAAGAIYLSAMLLNEPVTQKEISDPCDVSSVAIRDAYPEIAEYEGINLRHTSQGRRNGWNSKRVESSEVIWFGGNDE